MSYFSRKHHADLERNSFSKTGMLVFVLAFGVIGGIIALSSFALTPRGGQGSTADSNTAGQAPPIVVPSGQAGLQQLASLLSHYGQLADSSQGDLNGDGKVTAADLSLLLSNYSR